jgi:hypothetical protein
MSLPRKTVALIATAIPTLLIAILAAYVLIRFSDAHDHLGSWTLTVTDDHGAARAHGRLTLTTTGWTTYWSWRPPCITFIPNPMFSDDAGTITFTQPALDDLSHLTGAPWTWQTCKLSHPDEFGLAGMHVVHIQRPDHPDDCLYLFMAMPGIDGPPVAGLFRVDQTKPTTVPWHCTLSR